jgi:hypothetical protein
VRTINLRGLADALDAPALVGSATLTLQYCTSAGPVPRVAGPDVVFPASITVRLVDGVPVVPVVLQPTGPSLYVRVHLQYRTYLLSRDVQVPDGDGEIDFGALPMVNPATLQPLDPVPPSAQEILDQAGEARDAARDHANAASGFAGDAEEYAQQAHVDMASRLEKTQNLGDVPDKPAARGNLGLGDAATKSVADIAAGPEMTRAFVVVRTSDGHMLPPDTAVILTLDKTLAQITASPVADIDDITFEEV